MEEKWKEYYSHEDIKRIQEIELNSLRELIRICEILNIDFMLYGGSLLGAVKYSGFVPWDDDLDVAMMRNDYEIFLEKAPKLLSKDYEIQHPRNNKLSPYPYIKFRRNNTTLVEYAAKDIQINHGIYFDIYPIDNIPDDDDEYTSMNKKINKLIRLFIRRQGMIKWKPNVSLIDYCKYIKRIVESTLLKCIPHKYYITKLHKLMTMYNDQNTKRQGNYFYSKPVNYFIGVKPFQKVSFCGITVNIPYGYKINLTNRYGDISKLPPESDRIGHRPYKISFDNQGE